MRTRRKKRKKAHSVLRSSTDTDQIGSCLRNRSNNACHKTSRWWQYCLPRWSQGVGQVRNRTARQSVLRPVQFGMFQIEHVSEQSKHYNAMFICAQHFWSNLGSEWFGFNGETWESVTKSTHRRHLLVLFWKDEENKELSMRVAVEANVCCSKFTISRQH